MILSVSATAGLLLFSEPITQSLSRFLPVWLAVLFAVPLSAQLTCQPFIILLTPTFPTYGVLANVVAGPAAPLATIVGLIACVVITWLPLLAIPLLWIAWLPAQWVGATARSLSTFPIALIPWISGFLGFAVMAAVSLAVLILLLSTRAPWRRFSGLLLTSAVALWATTNVVQHLNFLHQLPATWTIAACDVGQGDGIIIRSAGHIAVIDVGRKPQPMTHCLEQLGITQVDLLVLTHFDKDHVGGLSALFGKVSHAIVGKPESSEDQDLLEELSESGTEVIRGHSGMTGQLGDAQWEVLWPDGKHPLMDTGNPGSVTMLVTFPQFNALFLGDLGKESQLALLNSTHLPHVNVVKVAHHGSADQSATLYEQIQPDIGIFSVGADNDYGHPRRETLDILERLHAITPRTDEDGLVLVGESPTGLSVWTEH
jgi:competence protein ComEC